MPLEPFGSPAYFLLKNPIEFSLIESDLIFPADQPDKAVPNYRSHYSNNHSSCSRKTLFGNDHRSLISDSSCHMHQLSF